MPEICQRSVAPALLVGLLALQVFVSGAAAQTTGKASAKESPKESTKDVAAKADGRAARQRELEDLRTRMDALRKDVNAAESQRAEAADALKASERAISEANRNLHELAESQRALAAELAETHTRAARAREDVALQRRRLADLLVHQYQYGTSDGFRLLLEGKDLAETERQARYLEYISRERLSAIARLKSGLEALSALEAELRSKQAALEANEVEQKAARALLESERSQRRKVLNSLAGDIAKGRREIGKLKRDEDRVSKLIEQLSRLIRPPAPRQPGTPQGQAIDQAADDSLAGQAFAGLKGKLRLPTKGELISRFGSAREGFSSKGIFIRAAGGQPVRAVADGQVVYADWMRGLGNFVIVDHGRSYLSLYGNAESVLKQVGDRVKSGDVLASAGDSGGAGESGVYFELRHQGQPFDPLKWMRR
ncbi:MAG: peptidoglycan DD-metalloendopeptidase family protein [Burkholderiales bacterium]|nr:peptidoglycan DD-metalloendopeptidase family protein [Burkholderiales bacterium]